VAKHLAITHPGKVEGKLWKDVSNKKVRENPSE